MLTDAYNLKTYFSSVFRYENGACLLVEISPYGVAGVLLVVPRRLAQMLAAPLILLFSAMSLFLVTLHNYETIPKFEDLSVRSEVVSCLALWRGISSMR